MKRTATPPPPPPPGLTPCFLPVVQTWEVIRCYAESASHCRSMPCVPGGDGCSLPTFPFSPPPDTQYCPLFLPGPLQCLNHSDYISSRFLIISYQSPSICLCSSVARGGISTAICHQEASMAWALPLRDSVRSLQNRNTSSLSPSHQLINRMYLVNFLPEPSRKWLLGASREIPGML